MGMHTSFEAVRRKILASYRALSESSQRHTTEQPSPAFAEDYNQCRQLLLECRPDSASILPPPARIIREQGKPDRCEGGYVEYLTFFSQLVSLVQEHNAEGPQHRWGQRD